MCRDVESPSQPSTPAIASTGTTIAAGITQRNDSREYHAPPIP